MIRSLRFKILLWFLFVVIAVGLAGVAGFRRLADYIRTEAKTLIDSKTTHVLDVLETTNSIYLDLVHSSMEVLIMLATQSGPPRLGPPVDGVPTLVFGDTPVNGSFALVDRVTEIMSGTATLFVRRGDEFVRVSTNVRQAGNERAVGTVLNPDGPAMAALREGRAFYGVVDILGRPYITGYAPIRDQDNEVIGVYYVGYALEALSTIKEALHEQTLLDSGFFALLAPNDEIIIRTKNEVSDEQASRIVHAAITGKPLKDWTVSVVTFEPWNYDVVAALYQPDITALSVEIIWQAYGFGSAIILGVLIVSFWLASRLSNALAAAEASRQEALAARDAAESANRTKSTFLANMSHELRTPMNAIIGYSEMLIEEAEDLELKSLTPDLQKIRSAGKHLLALINDVLDLSKIEAGRMTLHLENFSVAEMLNDVVATVAPLVEKNGNSLDVACAPEAGEMHADLTKVRQTLFNLLSNAAKFTERGTIRLTAARTPGEGGDRMTFSVTDTGIGMTPDQLGRLFQAFVQADASTTRKYGGTGLGLVISRKFCQMMGGDIQVRSEPGRGTTFTVDLPAAVAEPATPQPSPQSRRTRRGRTVLVIDDDRDAADLLSRNLDRVGYDVAVAHTGKEGLELARRLQPAAITLDVMMPGMDGWSVLTDLKGDPATTGIPVIMVTMVQDRQFGFALGASEFLTKPVSQDRLRQVIGKYCAAPANYVLVVEDESGNRQLLCRLLEREGIACREAENGSAALECVAAEPPSLILLDLMMPVMNGFEFLRTLRQNPDFARIPVVVITAKDLTAEDRQQLTGSVHQIIQKGAVDQEKLLHDVADMLAQTQPPAR